MESVSCLTDTTTGTVARSPSILQKNTKLYGPMNVLDYTNDTTSWNSEGNQPQDLHLTIDFKRLVQPQRISIQFQAGFAAETCTVEDEQGREIAALEVEDIHEVQSFPIEMASNTALHSLKLVFADCTDFYDRIIVYRLEVWGQEASSSSSSPSS